MQAHVLCFGGNQQKVRTFLGVGNVLVQPQTTQSYVKYQKAKGRIGDHDTETGAAGSVHFTFIIFDNHIKHRCHAKPHYRPDQVLVSLII